MRQIQEKEKAIKFLIDRTKKHLYEAYGKLDAEQPAKDCVDVSIYLINKVSEEMEKYMQLMSNRMQHYSNVASMLSEKMSKFSEEIRNLQDDEEECQN